MAEWEQPEGCNTHRLTTGRIQLGGTETPFVKKVQSHSYTLKVEERMLSADRGMRVLSTRGIMIALLVSSSHILFEKTCVWEASECVRKKNVLLQ